MDEEPGFVGFLVRLVQIASDPRFLRDIASLLRDEFGPDAETASGELEIFASLHAAPDKEAYLQRLDRATAIRRIWNLPEPSDTLAKKGRRKAR